MFGVQSGILCGGGREKGLNTQLLLTLLIGGDFNHPTPRTAYAPSGYLYTGIERKRNAEHPAEP